MKLGWFPLKRLWATGPPKNRERYVEPLRAAGMMTRIRNLPKLLNLIAQILASGFRASHVTIFLKDRHRPGFVLAASRGKMRGAVEPLFLDETDALVFLLSQDEGPVVLEELQAQIKRLRKADRRAAPAREYTRKQLADLLTRAVQEMERLQACLCVPAFLDKKLKCFFAVGKSLSGRPYRKEDLAALATLALQADLAIENAQAYEELRNTRDQLVESDRLAAIGKFASSVAHEIKSPLQSIISFFDFLPEKRNDPDFMDRFAKRVATEAQRINELVRELMTYSYLRPPKFEPLEMDQIIDSVLDLLENDLVKHQVEVRKGYSPNPMKAQADQNQMKQVFLNLFQNAVDAMASVEGRKHRLELVAFPNGKTLVVKIRDTGPGIPPHLLSRLFSVSFTTKKKGFGLGLTVVHQILQAHHATIDVKSQDGAGTTMTITLPCSQMALETHSGEEKPDKTEAFHD